jgi:hypothetical protein
MRGAQVKYGPPSEQSVRSTDTLVVGIDNSKVFNFMISGNVVL